MSAVATHAGVRRSTVYRHFPDEAALFEACTAHWAAANPPPDLDAWLVIGNPDECLGVALGDLYAFYRRTQPMLENVFRDETTVPLVQEHLAALRGYFARARDTLIAGRQLRGSARRRTHVALGHAIAFSTWKSLAQDEGLNDAESVVLMRALVAAAS